jgi:hypothetical protein
MVHGRERNAMYDDVPRWLRKQVVKEVTKDSLPMSERLGQLVAVPFTLIAIWFFAEHQSRPTGFFTDGFGSLEAGLFYGIIVIGLAPPIVRFLLGRKNPARLVDIVQMAFFLIAGVYLLSRFPFDFTYFAEVLPENLQPMFDWVTDGIAKFAATVALLAMGVAIPHAWLVYVYVRRGPSFKAG